MNVDNFLLPNACKKEDYKFINVIKETKYLFGKIDNKNLQNDYTTKKGNGSNLFQNSSAYSAGCCVQFISDSPEIIIMSHFGKEKKGNYPHVGISARAGISLAYSKLGDDEWYNIDCFCAKEETLSVSINMRKYVESQEYRFTIFFPILSQVQDLIIGIRKNFIIQEDIYIDRNNSIVFLGGLNIFGIGVTSTALIASNILFHRLNREIFNLGINARDIYYDCLLDMVDEIKPKVVILECDEMRSNRQIVIEKLPKYIEFLSNRYKLIIIMNIFNIDLNILDIVKKYRNSNVYILFRDDIIENEYQLEYISYSTNFINDYGQILIADKIMNTIINKKW